ncbi:MAG: FUSC family protein, partial [Sedimenticolaceae bacterium]
MILTTRTKEAFKTALAVVLAYGIALSMDWEKPMWAAFAITFISLATVGQSLHKGALRMLGTLVAGVVSLTLVALFPQERWWLMVFLSAFVGLCTYRMGGSKRPYFWNVAAFVSLIICMESVPATEYAFDLAVLRSLETGLGILCYTLVTVFLWPTGTAAELDAAVRGLAATQHRLYQGYLRLLAGKAEGEDLQPLRLQEVQQLGQFSDALMGARADTHEVWELRQQWARLEADVREMMAALARWRESFDEVQALDLKALMPEFPSLAEELDARLGQIERILSGKAPERQPKPLDPSLNTEAVRALSHFDRAALALFRSQLRRLESLTRSLFETAADIKGFAAVSVRPVEPTRTRAGFVLDADALVAAIRVVAGVWLAYLLWIYLEVPGGVGIVIMTGSLG